MSAKTDPPLRLELKCSTRLIRLMILIHALALVACVLNSLPVFVKFVLLVTIAVHGYIECKRLSTRQYRIEQTENTWQLGEDNAFVGIQILPSTVISIVAIFLQFKTEDNMKGTLVIFSDALAEDDYRCLIVRLKTTLSKE
jgi:hypothetical protein